MLLRMIYDDGLAHASYLIGCPESARAIVIDPLRDVDRYLQAAERLGLSIVAVAETHVHADYASGARELAGQTGAHVYLSAEGGQEWMCRWALEDHGPWEHHPLRDGDRFGVGRIGFQAIHTPGHTPEHICLLVTDRAGGATEPMGLLAGDFLFVGDLGRPDLLESAVGVRGAKEPAARDLHRSVHRVFDLPDYVQVWPAHGSGSACGKNLGGVPQSTIGYERRFNPAVRCAADEEEFVRNILADQPEPPPYFARMKRLNVDGPPVLGSLPRPPVLTGRQLLSSLNRRVGVVLDTRPWQEFRAGHIPGSICLFPNHTAATTAAAFVEPDRDIYVIAEPGCVDHVIRSLIRVGLDRVEGIAGPGAIGECRDDGQTLSIIEEADPDSIGVLAAEAAPVLLDVRTRAEYAAGALDGAINIPHTVLSAHLDELPRDLPLLVYCRQGPRSARACSFLQSRGFRVMNLAGGLMACRKEDLAVR